MSESDVGVYNRSLTTLEINYLAGSTCYYDYLRFLSTTVLQDSVATWVNDDRIFNDFFIANVLLSVAAKEV